MRLKTILFCARTILLLNILALGVLPEPASLKVKNATQALRIALALFQSQSLPQVPAHNINWAEKTIYAEGIIDYAVTGKQFTAADWEIEVTQDVAPLSSTIYLITVFNAQSGWYWKGNIKADGSIIEVSPFQFLPETEKGQIATEFLRKSRIPPPPPGGYGH